MRLLVLAVLPLEVGIGLPSAPAGCSARASDSRSTIEVFEFPQPFVEQFGGWMSSLMIEKYRALARFIFVHFGDRVKHFFSFHEPDTLCGSYGTSSGRFVGPRPSVNDSTVLDRGRDQYRCIHNMLLAHAAAG